MQLFLDTADINEIEFFQKAGLIDGVTTNPSLIAKSGRNFLETIKEISLIVSGPISAEVTATDYTAMQAEAEKLANIAPNITIKVPVTPDGLLVCRNLAKNGAMINVTLCFSPAQAILAAKAGATFVSPFVGRLDDVGSSGINLLNSIVTIFRNFPDITTKVIASSIRSVQSVVDAALVGADVATVPPNILRQMFEHPLTDKGVKTFVDDWAKTKQSIL